MIYFYVLFLFPVPSVSAFRLNLTFWSTSLQYLSNLFLKLKVFTDSALTTVSGRLLQLS